MPMPTFELIKDLSVNTGKWMDSMSKELSLGFIMTMKLILLNGRQN